MEFLTQAKLEELQVELENLRTHRRKEIAESLEYAKSLGDLSENAEYQQAREDQASCEDRILEIDVIIKNAVIAEHTNTGLVNVGSIVTLTGDNKDGEDNKGHKSEKVYELVGSEESDPANGRISNESPLGKALIGLAKGDDVSIKTPSGDKFYKIKSIK